MANATDFLATGTARTSYMSNSLGTALQQYHFTDEGTEAPGSAVSGEAGMHTLVV